MRPILHRPWLIVSSGCLCGVIVLPLHAGDPAAVAVRVHNNTTQGPAKLGTSVSTAGDVNADGVPDYIMGAPGTNQAFVYSGLNGQLLYQFDGEQDVHSFGKAVANAGDVNNDGFDDVIIGDPDLFVGCMPQGGAMVYSGADGSLLFFPAGVTGWEEFGAAVAAAGDVDADGYDDFIVGAPLRDPACIAKAGGVSVFSGYHGGEIFGAVGVEFAELGSAVAGLGDITGDGFGEIAASARGQSKVYIYNTHNYAVVRVLSGSTFGKFGWSIANVGDVNGDGVNDLGVGEPYHNFPWIRGKTHVYSGSDGALLHSWIGRVGGDGFGYSVGAAGDVNGDGFADVVVGSPFAKTDGQVTGRYEVRSGANGQIIRLLTANPGSLNYYAASVSGVGDTNGDGYSDVIVGAPMTGNGGGRAFVYMGGDNTLDVQPLATGAAFGSPTAVASGDLNGDGRADIVTASPASNRISILLTNDDGTLSAPVNKNAKKAPSSVAIGDYDHDGDNDLAIVASNSKSILLFRNNGNGKMSKRGALKAGVNPTAITTTDLNGDGRLDLIVANSGDDQIGVYLNKAQYVPIQKGFHKAVKYDVGDNPVQVIASDLNDDTLVDLLVLNADSQDISVFLNTADGTFQAKPSVPTGGQALNMVSADFNNDGKSDLAWLNSDGTVTWRLSYGHALFLPPNQLTVDPTTTALLATDIDFDGYADLVMTHAGDSTVTFALNNQLGGFETMAVHAGPQEGKAITTGDIDSDGDADIITVDSANANINVFENLWFTE